MKVLILAGGYGTRLGEMTSVRPKPMVEIGGRPILWHIMKGYSSFGFNDFVILCGYRGEIIKQYFANFHLNSSSIVFDFVTNKMETISSEIEPWRVTLLDTGIDTLTGGRIKRAQNIVGNSSFLLTYGDGIADVNIDDLLATHKRSGKLVTMTAVQPKGRFGRIDFEGDTVRSFKEKPETGGGWINGGFFVCEPQVFDYIDDINNSIFERAPLEKLAAEGQINSYKHNGFWHCMDTLADRNALEKLWETGTARWKTW